MEKPKFKNKECKHHGMTTYILEGRGFYRCQRCRNSKRTLTRRANKLKAIEFLGGACKKCGYNKCKDALHFNHIGKKTAEISRLFTWKQIEAELKYCELLCANCHAEFTMESGYACMK